MRKVISAVVVGLVCLLAPVVGGLVVADWFLLNRWLVFYLPAGVETSQTARAIASMVVQVGIAALAWRGSKSGWAQLVKLYRRAMKESVTRYNRRALKRQEKMRRKHVRIDRVQRKQLQVRLQLQSQHCRHGVIYFKSCADCAREFSEGRD